MSRRADARRAVRVADVVFSVRLPPALVRSVRVYAAREGREIREVVRVALARAIPAARL